MHCRLKLQFSDLIKFNDLGLPIAYAVENGIVKSSGATHNLIQKTFELLLEALEIEDLGFETVLRCRTKFDITKADAELRGKDKGSLR